MSQTKAQLIEGLNINTSAPADALVIDSSGRVGIGTTSPENNLHVADTSGPIIRLTNSTGSDGSYTGRITTGDAAGTFFAGINFFKHDTDDGEIRFRTKVAGSNQDTVTIVDGRVGIGTTSPSYLLDLSNSSNAYIRQTRGSSAFRVGPAGDQASDGVILGTDTNGPLRIFTNGSSNERMRIDTSGRLLVGTSSSDAQAKLVIQGQVSNSAAGAILNIQRGEAASSITSGEGIGNIAFTDNANKSFASINVQADGTAGTDDYPGRILFQTTADGASSPTERMRIDSSGRVGIGNTSPSQPLDVTGWVKTSVGLLGTYGRVGLGDSGGPEITTGALANPIKFIGGNGSANLERMRVDSSGRLLVGASATAGVGRLVQIAHTSSEAGLSATRYINDAGGAAAIDLAKSRNGTIGSQTIVQNGDALGYLQFRGSDGTNQLAAAHIKSQVDGTPGTNDMPGRLVFSTTADGASSPSERMRIDSAGKVGIGTTAPSELLHIAGATNPAITLQDTTNNTDARIKTNNNGDLVFEADYNNEQGDSRIGFEVDGSEKVRIDSSGNLAIGTTSIDRQFHVQGGGVAGTQVQIEGTVDSAGIKFVPASGADQYEIQATDNSALIFYNRTDGAERMQINGSGNVGIGTSSPNHRLTLHNSGTGTFDALNITSGLTNSVGLQFGIDSASNVFFWHTANGAIKFATNNAERIRITNNGLTFNGDTAATNALDDYEEGTWTPQFGSTSGSFTSVTYSIQSGNYTKIGNRVYFECRLQKTAHTVGSAGGGLLVTGLPYTVNSPTGIGGNCALSNIDIPASVINLAIEMRENSSQFYVALYTRDNATFGNIGPGNLSSGTSEVRASGFYYTNS